MELYSIKTVAKKFNISTRTLRYYEQIGLIYSKKKDDFTYRVYDEPTLRRLQQIIILRKLRIPLKQINDILNSEDSVFAINVFQENISELNNEIIALSTIKSILQLLVEQLNKNCRIKIDLGLLENDVLDIVNSLAASKINFNEDKTMEDLNNASEHLLKLKDVRVIYLPPFNAASVHLIGGRPEDEAIGLVNQFIKSTRINDIKPDFRVFGFNHPDGNKPDGSDHGYEFWITIPDGIELPPPFVKKTFAGGLYAAHVIPMGAFEEWNLLWKWVESSEKYEFNLGDPECMNGLLEENLNYINLYMLDTQECNNKMQLDLLIPIRERS